MGDCFSPSSCNTQLFSLVFMALSLICISTTIHPSHGRNRGRKDEDDLTKYLTIKYIAIQLQRKYSFQLYSFIFPPATKYHYQTYFYTAYHEIAQFTTEAENGRKREEIISTTRASGVELH